MGEAPFPQGRASYLYKLLIKKKEKKKAEAAALGLHPGPLGSASMGGQTLFESTLGSLTVRACDREGERNVRRAVSHGRGHNERA